MINDWVLIGLAALAILLMTAFAMATVEYLVEESRKNRRRNK